MGFKTVFSSVRILLSITYYKNKALKVSIFCVCFTLVSSLCVQSGALLACGIVNSGVRNECDPALALLSDYVLHNSNVMRIGAIFG